MEYNDKNMKICELLGAKQFQQVVFTLEKIKYQIIEKIFPDIMEWYDKYSEKNLKLKLAKCSEEERIKVINEYRIAKLSFKKELIYHENQNYHLDLENPTFFVNYLKFNRKIHIDGLKSNIVFIGLLILLMIIFNGSLMWMVNLGLLYNIVSLLINFQCINLQNYNLCRLENVQIKELLQRREKKIKEEKIKKYGKGMAVIGKTFQETTDIPTVDEILINIKTNEERKQLLLYFKKQLEILEKKTVINNKDKVRCKRK